MVEIARKHHEDLLTQGYHPGEGEQQAAIKVVLEEIDNTEKLDGLTRDKLGMPIDEDIVRLA